MTEFSFRNRAEWIAIHKRIFGSTFSDTQEWTSLNDIIRVLTPFCKLNSNHMFLPEGGGLDLNAVALSHESGCIELLTDTVPNIIRPARVLLESFPDCLSMSYFRIETQPLAPSGVYDQLTTDDEEVVETSPGHYVQRGAWDLDFYDDAELGPETPLPENARLCIRWLSGAFVVFAKGSFYNVIRDTYDALHTKMNAVEFRVFVQRIISDAQQRGIAE